MTAQSPIESALQQRILVLDGATGTAFQDLSLKPDDFGGPDLEGCNEALVLSRPDLVEKVHQGYLEAGCDIVETNTFGGTPIVLDEYGLGHRAREINRRAAEIAKATCKKFSTPSQPRFVAGSIGPTTKAISVTGGITFDGLIENFRVQALGLTEGGSDYLLIETCQDTRNIKAAVIGIQQAFKELGDSIPIAISGTIEPMGTMLAGQSVDALLASVDHVDLLYIGLNCATGPEFMTDHIRTLAKLSKFRVGCVPNAGLPDERGCYLETPQMLGAVLDRFLASGWLNVIGGCCGTHSGHIREMVALAKKHSPRQPSTQIRSTLSGIEALEITDDLRPILVGERTNVIGSKKFKTLICDEKFEEASEVARAQVRGGAQIIDICLANPDRNELSDMRNFMEFVTKKVKAPLMIDSTDAAVIEDALKYCQGKAIINSINLEDGEERFEHVIPLAKKYGAALVVGTIDDDPQQGMGVSRARKLEIAERSYVLLTEKYDISPADIYWDPLVFPCATGDAQYVGSAVETIEGIRLIKAKYPQTKTVLGISNVSFGLPPAGREVLNSVFLYHCVQAGLDLAIVNSEKLERYASIPPEEIKLADDLLFTRGEDPVAAFANFFRERKAGTKVSKKTLPLMERLGACIVEGSKEGLVDDLNEALKAMTPLAIINGPLMRGMDEVGRLFNANQLIVAEVLQSAEAMKAAVSHLEQFMEKSESSQRGTVLLATVKGDVHDIGKNLVEIILANNGFKVINLGIKIPPEQLIKAVKEHTPDIIGLSGLLVKSAQQMVVTADDLSRSGIATPILVGGAALSSNFVDDQISKAYTGTVAYAKDAMSGLDLAKKIVDTTEFEKLRNDLKERRAARASNQAPKAAAAPAPVMQRSQTSVLEQIPQPTDFERHILKTTPIDQIWHYINPLMLYGRHLGIQGGTVRKLERMAQSRDSHLMAELRHTEPRALEVWNAVDEVKTTYRGTPIMRPAAIYRFFEAEAQGERVIVNTGSGSSAQWTFPRQTRAPGLCLADYLRPGGTPPPNQLPSALKDNLALFVVTVGQGVRQESEKLKNSGEYLKSHILQALALESAEAYAEWLHSQIRRIWGFADPPDMTMMQRFQAKYRGKRYSFGYPACPRLDDQATLWQLLQPQEIGVELTEGFMMDPEASVSAIVFHHPEASYFSVGTALEEQRQ